MKWGWKFQKCTGFFFPHSIYARTDIQTIPNWFLYIFHPLSTRSPNDRLFLGMGSMFAQIEPHTNHWSESDVPFFNWFFFFLLRAFYRFSLAKNSKSSAYLDIFRPRTDEWMNWNQIWMNWRLHCIRIDCASYGKWEKKNIIVKLQLNNFCIFCRCLFEWRNLFASIRQYVNTSICF